MKDGTFANVGIANEEDFKQQVITQRHIKLLAFVIFQSAEGWVNPSQYDRHGTSTLHKFQTWKNEAVSMFCPN